MGKRLIISGADFSQNAIVGSDVLSPIWAVNGFIYDVDTKAYSDNSFILRAYALKAGDSVIINTTGTSVYSVPYAQNNVAVGGNDLAQPTPTGSGVSLGALTKLVTTLANQAIEALRAMTYEATADCTLLITTGVSDTATVNLSTEG